MSLASRLRGLLGGASHDPEKSEYVEELRSAAQHLAEVRGDQVTALPADHQPNSIENVAAAAKDYGLSRFSGESDALGMAADGYRPASKPKKRRH